MNIYRGDHSTSSSMGPATSKHGESQAIAKIAFLTSVFEKLVAEAGLRRERIEQMLAELCDERPDVTPLGSTAMAMESAKRAA